MRLIDAEQIGLTDMEIIMCDGNYKKALEMLIDKIANAPSIDAVQVVRCKDCKHKTDCFSEVAMTNKYQTTTLYEPIEWCSKAERKES